MIDLPKGWIWVSLSQLVLKLVDGSHNPPSKQSDGLPMLSARNIIDGKIVFDEFRLIKQEDFEIEDKRTNVSPDDILLTIVGTIGRSVVVSIGVQKFTLQRSVAVVRPLDGIDSQYLKYEFDTPEFQQWMIDNAKGTAQKGIYLKQLGSASIPLPPLNEQHRIVAKLDTLFSHTRKAREELDRIPKLIKRYKQAVLSAAFRGDLTEDWRRENPDLSQDAIQEDQKIDAKELPKGWKSITLDKIGQFESGGTPSKEKSNYWGGDIPFVTGADITNLYISSQNARAFLSKEGLHSGKTAICKPKTVLFVTRTRVGRVGIATEIMGASQDLSPYTCSSYLFPEYLCHYLSSISDCLLANCRGSTILGLTRGFVKSLIIPLSPLPEQQEIVRRVEKLFKAIEQMEAQYQKASKLLDRLEQATLSKAFRGELVPQDPNDEAASVLLERILAEKQPKKTAKPRK